MVRSKTSSYDDTAGRSLAENHHDKQKLKTFCLFYNEGRPGNHRQPKDQIDQCRVGLIADSTPSICGLRLSIGCSAPRVSSLDTTVSISSIKKRTDFDFQSVWHLHATEKNIDFLAGVNPKRIYQFLRIFSCYFRDKKAPRAERVIQESEAIRSVILVAKTDTS